MRKWNLLLASQTHGIVGPITEQFPEQPKFYERVPVVAIEDVLKILHDSRCDRDDIETLISDLESRKP
jgi:hypothetical protein